MKYEVLLTDEASEDASSAFEWYDEQLEGLGEEFYKNLLTLFEQLAQFPHTGKNIEFGIKKALVPTYPYAVYYSVKGEEVRVLRILYQGRHPDTWKK